MSDRLGLIGLGRMGLDMARSFASEHFVPRMLAGSSDGDYALAAA